jgi:PLP dependent protein
MTISERINKIQAELPQGVQLVAVSKTKPKVAIMEAYESGHRDFGENRVQEMTEKQAELPKDIRWHMIGHVQTNKIKYFAEYVHLVHGVDREKVLKELDKEAKKAKRVINCLLQVHIAKEESKFGFDEDEIKEVCKHIEANKYPHIRCVGLMGMATFTDNNEIIHAEFLGLKKMFDKLKKEYPNIPFQTLSMGMSSDYPLAIECGSNMVRVGSAIFGSRN